MIQQTSFLGISLRTTLRRRALVVVYYGFLGLLLGVAFWKQRFVGPAFLIQTLTLGGLFGGIQAGRTVKPYSATIPDPGQSGVQELNLSGIKPATTLRLLDERELHERDHAHYISYCILRWALCLITAVYLLGMSVAPHFLANNAPNLLWGLTVFVLSVPQSVILWTEPAPLPDFELSLVESREEFG